MQQAKKIYILPFYFILLTLMSCSNLFNGINGTRLRLGVSVTNINNLSPHDNQATVYLQGKVAHLVPLLKQWTYQLQDSTGKIWILTNHTGIQPGDEVLIKGKVHYKSIFTLGKDIGEVYVEEQDQLERIPAHY